MMRQKMNTSIVAGWWRHQPREEKVCGETPPTAHALVAVSTSQRVTNTQNSFALQVGVSTNLQIMHTQNSFPLLVGVATNQRIMRRQNSFNLFALLVGVSTNLRVMRTQKSFNFFSVDIIVNSINRKSTHIANALPLFCITNHL